MFKNIALAFELSKKFYFVFFFSRATVVSFVRLRALSG